MKKPALLGAVLLDDPSTGTDALESASSTGDASASAIPGCFRTADVRALSPR